MQKNRSNYLKNIILPCLIYSGICGIFTGILIFLFKFVASHVISFSAVVYEAVRDNPLTLPLLLIGAAVLGIISAVIIKNVPDSRGGGIPSSIAITRGLIDFKWIKTVVFVFLSSLVTYLGGVPLGNEGPSVLMGTAVGRGTSRLLARKNTAWDRYIMTGGACAGFAAATGSPLAGIFFFFEEAHRKFSPMLFMSSTFTVIAGMVTMNLLCELTNTSPVLFHFVIDNTLPAEYFWAPLLVGIAAGAFAILFTKVYISVRKFKKSALKRIPYAIKTITVFVMTALIGFTAEECIGSGHHLVEALAEGHGIWFMLLIVLLIRSMLLIFATNSDITGGLFVPTLAIGAIVGAVCGKGLMAAGILPEEYYIIMVIIGIAAFLGASSRTPLMAIAFAIEALSGFANILPVTIGVAAAYLVIELSGIKEFTDVVIESKVEAAHRGKEAQVINMHLTVKEGSFAVGKEIKDILWPPTCTVLSVHKKPTLSGHVDSVMEVGDVIHVHYETHDPEHTMRSFEALIGRQTGDLRRRMHIGEETHRVPEI